MGLHMVSGIIVGCLLGYWLDKWFGTYPWCAGVGLIVGIGAGFRNIWLDARILLRQGNRTMQAKAAEITARSIGWRRGCGGAACRTPRSGKSCAGRSASLPCPCFFGAVLWPFHPAGRGSSGLASERCSPHGIFALIKFVPKVISAGWSKSSLLPFSSARTWDFYLPEFCCTWFWYGLRASISAVLLGLAVLLVGMTAGGLKKRH